MQGVGLVGHAREHLVVQRPGCIEFAGAVARNRAFEQPGDAVVVRRFRRRVGRLRGHQAISTVNAPSTIAPPWAVESPIRAAGWPLISTVGAPLTIVSGGPTHTAMSPRRAAGRLQISTVGAQGGPIGPPTCGTGPVDIGQACMSVRRAAGLMFAA